MWLPNTQGNDESSGAACEEWPVQWVAVRGHALWIHRPLQAVLRHRVDSVEVHLHQ